MMAMTRELGWLAVPRFAGDFVNFNFEQPGLYIGQLLFEKLVLAEFTITVGSLGAPSEVQIDLDALCRVGRSGSHFSLETDGGVLFRGFCKEYTVQLARESAQGFQLVYTSNNAAPAISA